MKNLIYFPHGAGDAIALSSVLQHLKHKFPGDENLVAVQQGQHTGFQGLAEAYTFGQEPKGQARVYKLGWHECKMNFKDLPATKAVLCLRTVFHIQPDWDLLRYQVHVSPEAEARALAYVASLPKSKGLVLIHYQGTTSPPYKDLTADDVQKLCDFILSAGYLPCVIDLENKSPLPDNKTIIRLGKQAKLWHGRPDTESLTAVISLAKLFVGVDSGPQKAAFATRTRTIGVWTRHHPIHFVDNAPNAVHLLPIDHTRFVKGKRINDSLAFFHSNYKSYYYGDNLAAMLVYLAAKQLGEEAPFAEDLAAVPELPPDLVCCEDFCVPCGTEQQCKVIVDDVYKGDAYKLSYLPKRSGAEYVVDLGANIGCFSRLIHERNSKAQICAVEVNPKLIPALETNVGEYAKVIQAACHYGTEPLYLLDSLGPNCVSSGGSRVVTKQELEACKEDQYVKSYERLKTITLEEVCRQCSFPRIDLLKLDVEGSEWSILQHCDLTKVKSIVLESHGPRSKFAALRISRFGDWYCREISGDAKFQVWHLLKV